MDEVVKISVLVVNLNNLDYTKNCIQDLTNQDVSFNLTVIDQNSSENGTWEYLNDLSKKHLDNFNHGYYVYDEKTIRDNLNLISCDFFTDKYSNKITNLYG